MDDDIRDRFRGASRRDPTPTSYGRQARPARPSASQSNSRQDPVEKSAWPSILAEDAKKSSQLSRTPPSDRSNKRAKKNKRKFFKRNKKRLKKSKKKIILMAFLLIVLLLAGGMYFIFLKGKKSDKKFEQSLKSTNDTSAVETPKPTGTIRFIAVGDSMAFDSINSAAKQPDGTHNYLPMMSGFKPFFDKSDIRLCNETTPGGGDKDGLAISAYPTFNAPTEWSSGFAGLGCNLIDLASKNINDKGQPAIDSTLKVWDKTEKILAVAGANKSAEDQAKIRYFTVKGIKFAYLAYTTRSLNTQLTPYGLNIYSDDLATKQIADAHKNSQLVIVSINWGTEDSNDINPDQEHIAKLLASQNADVVLGSGPNVLQPAKIIDGKDGHQTLVWFSLGNFLGSQLPLNNLIGGMAIMDFDVATQKIQDPKILPVYMHYEWTAAQKASNQVNARHDFMLWPLDLATDALAKSQNNTTVEAQTSRVNGIITKFIPIKVIKSTEF